MRNLACSNGQRDFWLKSSPERYLQLLETHKDLVFSECWTDDQSEAAVLDSHTIENTIARAALVLGVIDDTMRSVAPPAESPVEADDGAVEGEKDAD